MDVHTRKPCQETSDECRRVSRRPGAQLPLSSSFSLSLCLAPAVRGRSSTTSPAIQRPKKDRMQSRNQYCDSDGQFTCDQDGCEWAQMICCDKAMVLDWDENGRLKTGIGGLDGARALEVAVARYSPLPARPRAELARYG